MAAPLARPVPPAFHPPEKGSGKKKAEVRVIRPADLWRYAEAWRKLADTAIVANAFYEDWTLLPALSHLAANQDIRILLVLGPPAKGGSQPLWGLFPLEIRSHCLKLPIRSLAFWQHRHCFFAVPLIDAGHAWQTLDAFWRWFENNPFGCRILDTNHLIAEGPFHTIWAEFALGRAFLMLSDYPRAFLDVRRTSASYRSDLVSKKHLDEFRRQERRFAELGTLEYSEPSDPSAIEVFLEEFLSVEASGWKRDADAMGLRSEDAAYFRTITREGFLRGALMLLSLRLDGKAIALKHNLLAGDGGFTFKIAFDERYAKFSPGLLLELENIRRARDNPRINWLDSCASPRHPMANRIWNERRMIRRTLFSDGSRLGDFWISLFPVLRWMFRLVKPCSTPGYFEILTRS